MAKINAHGTLFKLSDGAASPTLTTVAQVETISGPGMSRGTENVPTHDDSGAIKKLADALYDGGVLTLGILYDPAAATHDASTGLIEALEDGDERDNQLVFPDTANTTWTLPSVITGFEPTGLDANTGKLRANVEVTVTDTPTLA